MGGPRRPTHRGKPNFQPATYHSPLRAASKPPQWRFAALTARKATWYAPPVPPPGNPNFPNQTNIFPTGDGQHGGEFHARFTVDSRPEIGVWANGQVWVDINGNGTFDPDNTDFTNRDFVFTQGFTSDDVFAGNFTAGMITDGFDKLGAYGQDDTGTFRFLIDVTNDGVADNRGAIRAYFRNYLMHHPGFRLRQIDALREADDVLMWDALVDTENGILMTVHVIVFSGDGRIRRHIPGVRGYWGG